MITVSAGGSERTHNAAVWDIRPDGQLDLSHTFDGNGRIIVASYAPGAWQAVPDRRHAERAAGEHRSGPGCAMMGRNVPRRNVMT